MFKFIFFLFMIRHVNIFLEVFTIVNVKKWINGQSDSRKLSYPLQAGRLTRSQVKPDNSLESYLQKRRQSEDRGAVP